MYTRSEINKFLRNYKCTGSQKKTAQDFADFAYIDQKDKAGGTLMSHAERVVEYLEKNGYGDEVVIVGYLHDILDNGGFCQSDLSMFFPPEVCEAVSHLSHNKTSCREEYLTKIMENKIATIVNMIVGYGKGINPFQTIQYVRITFELKVVSFGLCLFNYRGFKIGYYIVRLADFR